MTFQPGLEYHRIPLDSSSGNRYSNMMSRIPDYHRPSPTKVMSGRIEKPRSTHASPAYSGRQRAWSRNVENLLPHTLTASTLSFDQVSTVFPSHHQYQSTYQSRSTGWHPSTHPYLQPQAKFSQSMSLIPYQVTPTSHQMEQSSIAITPVQLPHMNQLFDSPPELYMSNGPSSTSPASTVYSADCSSNPSPTFHLTHYHHQSPAVLDSTPITNYSGGHKMTSNQYTQYAEIPSKQPEICSEPEQIPSVIQSHIEMSKFEDLESLADDDGEVLVALGLYDAPLASRMSLFSTGKSLMLAEAWQPSEESDEDAEDEDDEENNEENDGAQNKMVGDVPEQSEMTERSTNAKPSILPKLDEPTSHTDQYHHAQQLSHTQINQTMVTNAQSWYETYPRQQLQHLTQPTNNQHTYQGPAYEGSTWLSHHT